VTDTRPAPYPADTRAKGWRFELDYEQIEQSDTWGVTKPEARPWLLMLWMTAWKQVPCGSMPADHDVIAGKLGIPDDLWEKHRASLLRGWWQADDGRMYHDTLTKRVDEMMRKRRSDSDRQAAKRAREASESAAIHGDVTRDTEATHTDVGRESSTDNRPPITEEEHSDAGASVAPTPAGKAPAKRAASKRKAKEPTPTADVWESYRSAYQRRYGADPLRNAMVNGQLSQFVTRVPADEAPAVAAYFVGHDGGLYVAAMHPTNLLLRDAEKLRTEWLTKRVAAPARTQPTETAYARQMREKYEQVCPDIAAKRPGAAAPLTVDMEPSDALTIR